jgi:predicted MPP superfamily phosphohydrolase
VIPVDGRRYPPHTAGVLTFMLRLTPEGRGRNFSVSRGVTESLLRLLYWGSWPARLWAVVPGACVVDKLHHRIPLLHPGAPTVRAGFISDIHLGPTTPRRLVDAAFGHLASSSLDVLLLGGDYVFLDATEAKARELAARVRDVPAKTKLAVLGNHDLWAHHAVLERALEGVGVEILINRNVRLGTGPGSLWVAGVDEPWTGRMDVERALDGVEDAGGLVVLCHSPEGLPETLRVIARMGQAAPPTLYVCGHTHGGHLATPWGAIGVPGPTGKRYQAGRYRVGDVDVHVSRGVGAGEVPVRTFAPPDVAVFELVPRAFD